VWIKKNEIYENNDGIIVLCAIPVILENKIYKNKNMGTRVNLRYFNNYEFPTQNL
jgi:hypothetical protein